MGIEYRGDFSFVVRRGKRSFVYLEFCFVSLCVMRVFYKMGEDIVDDIDS